MDIMADACNKIENSIDSKETAVKWALLTLCRAEYEFYAFADTDNIRCSFSLKALADKCIGFVCDNKTADFSKDTEDLRNFCSWLYDETENGNVMNLYYFMPCLENLESYLQLLDGNETPDSVSGFILSAIPEDYISDKYGTELENFGDNNIVSEELNRIWQDRDFIKSCTLSQLKEKAEQYRTLNILKI